MAISTAKDWDTDGDGMPDGFEYCFSFKDNHPFGVSNPQKAVSELLSPSNASDGYNDWDEDGLNNLEEYQVALKFDLVNGLPSLHHLGLKIQTKTDA